MEINIIEILPFVDYLRMRRRSRYED